MTFQLPENSGVIIQARTGSTRLPGKMSNLFHNGLTLAEVIFKKLQPLTSHLPVVLATSENKSNDCLQQWAEKYGLKVFRGAEDDVLGRFIGAAEKYQIQTVVRVCADNPFLSTNHITELLSAFKAGEEDYLSYQMKDGTPVIKSHLGLFSEVVTLDALKKAYNLTSESLYREHVTNYIYAHPEIFKVRFLGAPSEIADRKDIRLTIDTAEDFKNAAAIFETLIQGDQLEVEIPAIVDLLRKNPVYLGEMKNEINKNAK